jgi:hypothetical protein
LEAGLQHKWDKSHHLAELGFVLGQADKWVLGQLDTQATFAHDLDECMKNISHSSLQRQDDAREQLQARPLQPGLETELYRGPGRQLAQGDLQPLCHLETPARRGQLGHYGDMETGRT